MGKKNYECVSLISTNNNSFITFREERQNNLDYFLSRSLDVAISRKARKIIPKSCLSALLRASLAIS